MEKSRSKEQEQINEMMKMKKSNKAKSEKEGTKMKIQKCRIEETKLRK